MKDQSALDLKAEIETSLALGIDVVQPLSVASQVFGVIPASDPKAIRELSIDFGDL